LQQASSTSIPKDLLASTIQSSRYSEYAKSSFIGTQSMSSFGSTVSSASNPAISQSEVCKKYLLSFEFDDCICSCIFYEHFKFVTSLKKRES